MTGTPRDGAAYLADVEALAALVRERAADADRLARMPAEVVAAIQERRLFRAWIPRSLGGDELPVPDAVVAFEMAAKLDGAFGWTVAIGAGGGVFAALLPRETAAEVYGRPDAVIAGSGTPAGTAERVAGGYVVAGRWAFASGAHFATYFTTTCTVTEGGAPVVGADGTPVVTAVAVPPEDVRLIETWDVAGMRGTGSVDMAIDGAFVPERRAFSVFAPPLEPGPLYRLPFMTTAQATLAPVAIGIGAHALEVFADLALRKPVTGGLLAGLGSVQARYAEAVALVSAARAWFRETIAAAWQAVQDCGAISDAQAAAVSLAAMHAGASAARATDLLWEVAGARQLYRESELGRCWRDVHAVAQHPTMNPEGLERAGAGLLGSRRGG
jgi:alkylation response protein AidB-like acyl-CoA dehydrogenase